MDQLWTTWPRVIGAVFIFYFWRLVEKNTLNWRDDDPSEDGASEHHHKFCTFDKKSPKIPVRGV